MQLRPLPTSPKTFAWVPSFRRADVGGNSATLFSKALITKGATLIQTWSVTAQDINVIRISISIIRINANLSKYFHL